LVIVIPYWIAGNIINDKLPSDPVVPCIARLPFIICSATPELIPKAVVNHVESLLGKVVLIYVADTDAPGKSFP
jgi:hypothetical protein